MLLFSGSAMSDSLRPHGLHHTRLPSPSPSPGVCSNSRPLSQKSHQNHLVLCHPLLLLPSILPSIRIFSNELVLRIRWPKYWSFRFNISPSNEYLELISFRIDVLISLLSKGLSWVFSNTTVQRQLLFSAQPSLWSNSHPYLTTGKTIALTIWTFVGKIMYLLFNPLSRFVIVFLPRSKCLLMPWLQSPSAVILVPKKIKSVTVSIVSPFICHEVMGPDVMILVFGMLSFNPAFHSPLWPSSRGSLVIKDKIYT